MAAEGQKMTCEACGHEQLAPAPPAATPPMRASEAMQESTRKVAQLSAENERLTRELREATSAGKRPLVEAERAELTVLRARARQQDQLAKAGAALKDAKLDGYMDAAELAQFHEAQWPVVLGKLIAPMREAIGNGERPMPGYGDDAPSGSARRGSAEAALAVFADSLAGR